MEPDGPHDDPPLVDAMGQSTEVNNLTGFVKVLAETFGNEATASLLKALMEPDGPHDDPPLVAVADLRVETAHGLVEFAADPDVNVVTGVDAMGQSTEVNNLTGFVKVLAETFGKGHALLLGLGLGLVEFLLGRHEAIRLDRHCGGEAGQSTEVNNLTGFVKVLAETFGNEATASLLKAGNFLGSAGTLRFSSSWSRMARMMIRRWSPWPICV
jgi:hypothetical protein